MGQFPYKTKKFLEKTASHTNHDFNPGGYYKAAVLPRDASYILKDQLLSTKSDGICGKILEALFTI
jgi:hypothetical protein